MAKQTRKLRNIHTKEVSLVERPASEVPFLFFKQKGKSNKDSSSKKTKLIIGIESNGTAKGTKVTINGDVMKSLRDFSFSFWGGMSDDKDTPVSCSYSKVVEATDGFKRTESFYLSKGEFEVDELKELVRKYIGDDDLTFEKSTDEEVMEALTSSIKTITGYKEDFPEDLEKAIGIIAKQMVSATAPVKKEEGEAETKPKEGEDEGEGGGEEEGENKEEIEKIKRIRALVKELDGLLPKKEARKLADVEKSIQKTIAGLTKAVEDMKKSNPKESEELKKSLDSINKRLKTVEETAGVKKSVDGQEEESGGGEDGEKKWPSLSSR